MAQPIRLYLLHPTYRLMSEALRAELAVRAGVELAGAAGPGERDLPQRLGEASVDVVLIDASTDLDVAAEMIAELRAAAPQMRLVTMGVATPEAIVELIEAGANGYVELQATVARLLDVVEEVHAGRAPISPEVADAVFRRLARLAESRPAVPSSPEVDLTPRETEVLKLLARGLRNKEIAERLTIRLPTVKNHVHRIIDKLGASDRRNAVQIAYRLGLLEGEPS